VNNESSKLELARTIVQAYLSLDEEPPRDDPDVIHFSKKDMDWLKKVYLLAEKIVNVRNYNRLMREMIEGQGPPPGYKIESFSPTHYYITHDKFGMMRGLASYREALQSAWEDYKAANLDE
jgi:hypothetical protein